MSKLKTFKLKDANGNQKKSPERIQKNRFNIQ